MWEPEHPPKGVARLVVERKEAAPGSGYYLMESATSKSGYGAVYTVEIHDADGKWRKFESGSEGRVFATIDVGLDIVRLGPTLEDVQARLEAAMNED